MIRRLLVLAAGLALTACGTTTVAAPPTTAAAPASQSCADDTTATATGPVTLTDGVGRQVTLSKPATRVAVLEWQQVEDTLSLCVNPVAVADPAGYTTYVSAEKLPAGVTDVGTRDEPDLDALYGTSPDLVIVEAFSADDEKIAQLESRGVPVLATLGADRADPIGNMKSVFTMIATATGRGERARQVLAEFDRHLAEAKAEVSAISLPTKDFVFFDGWVEGGNVAIRPYGEGALFTALGEQLGMRAAWTDAVDQGHGSGGIDPAYGLAQTDIEGLTAVGTANLFYADDDTADDYVLELQKSPIWTALPAVQQGRAHAFPSGVWGGGGPRSTEQAIDAYVTAMQSKG
jgi:ferric hydroxamate transport system substrate-binding protein